MFARLMSWLRRLRRKISGRPVAVGDFEAQKRFIKGIPAFLRREYPKLSRLSNRVFIRTLAPPDETERRRLLGLPENDPAVVAFEDKAMTDPVVFYLGRMAADDFGVIITLSGNGRGFGAVKIVRA